jgi:perosamine synthetase
MKRIPVAQPCFLGNEKKYVNDCLDTTWISSAGAYINRFEESFAKYCGVKHALSCCNGTVALHLPLLAYDIGPGDEIIVPTLTYIATANAVRYCGATPVFADSDPVTWNVDPMAIEKAITPKTKGIIVVHLYGNPVDMDAVMDIAERHNLFVIEDAAEAHGATYKEKMIGSIGHVNTFSFFGNKIISTGEGGMITTNDEALASKMRLLKGQGMDPKRRYWFPVIGYNYRMTNIEAAIGLAQLENIEQHLEDRQKINGWYRKHLDKLHEYIDYQVEQPDGHSVVWMFSVLFSKNVSISRDTIMEKLTERGIETRPVFYPLHIMPPYREEDGKYPVAEDIASRGINLPTYTGLTEEEVEYICEKIESIITGK